MRQIPKRFRGPFTPFDLTSALTGAPVVTRNGFRVTELSVMGETVYGSYSDEQEARWTLDGSLLSDTTTELDLFMGRPEVPTFSRRCASRFASLMGGAR
jgi:hypothetical protein